MREALVGILALMLLAAPGCEDKSSSDGYKPVNPVTLDLQGVPEDGGVFPSGAMAGDPGVGSMLLWTQSTEPAHLRLRVWVPGIDPGDASKVDLRYDAAVTPSPAGFVHQRAGNLAPGVRHEYAFTIESVAGSPTARSRIGSFVVAPPAGARVRLTFSGTHGTHQEEAPYPNLATNAALEPFTLYIHMGDAVYADDAKTVEEYRQFWSDNWQTEGFQAVLKDAVYLPVWDDHEVANNYNPETIDPAQLQAAIDAFFESNPMERFPDAPNQYWRSWRWGDTVEFFALDCRSERKPTSRETAYAEYISVAQMTWLQDALSASTAVFKIVLDSVPILNLDPKIWMTVGDSWRGYASQRDELIEFLYSEEIENVYFATGDYHMATVGRVEPVGTRGDHLWEFMLGPGAQNNPLGDRQAIIDSLGEEFDPLPPPQYLWGYPKAVLTYVDLDPLSSPPRLTLRYYEPDDRSEVFRVTLAGGEIVEP